MVLGTISPKCLGTFAAHFRLIDQLPPLPLNTMLIYGRYTHSTQVNLPADNSHGCICLTQHCFKGGEDGHPSFWTGNLLFSFKVLY